MADTTALRTAARVGCQPAARAWLKWAIQWYDRRAKKRAGGRVGSRPRLKFSYTQHNRGAGDIIPRQVRSNRRMPFVLQSEREAPYPIKRRLRLLQKAAPCWLDVPAKRAGGGGFGSPAASSVQFALTKAGRTCSPGQARSNRRTLFVLQPEREVPLAHPDAGRSKERWQQGCLAASSVCLCAGASEASRCRSRSNKTNA
jgi:hypothetical protein